MNHVMLDVDGTLIQSYELDEKCFLEAVKQAIGLEISTDWDQYPYVTDRGILQAVIKQHALTFSWQELEALVKPIFIGNVERMLVQKPAKEIAGAGEFIATLRKSAVHIVSIATGGWAETAQLKLQTAGIDTSGVVIASSNDHYSRTEIMQIARAKADPTTQIPVTYFGDAAWDLKACEALEVNAVIVGDRVEHTQSIPNFQSLELALSFVD